MPLVQITKCFLDAFSHLHLTTFLRYLHRSFQMKPPKSKGIKWQPSYVVESRFLAPLSRTCSCLVFTDTRVYVNFESLFSPLLLLLFSSIVIQSQLTLIEPSCGPGVGLNPLPSLFSLTLNHIATWHSYCYDPSLRRILQLNWVKQLTQCHTASNCQN